jgi:hypothetical protein
MLSIIGMLCVPTWLIGCTEQMLPKKGYLAALVCTWAQNERPADLHMAQPNVPVSKTGHFPPARLVRGGG